MNGALRQRGINWGDAHSDSVFCALCLTRFASRVRCRYKCCRLANPRSRNDELTRSGMTIRHCGLWLALTLLSMGGAAPLCAQYAPAPDVYTVKEISAMM